jgi:hypothetical protein
MDTTTPEPDTVQPGLLVEVEITYQSEQERRQVVIVPDEQADYAAGFLGAGTPLAQAILGEKVGSLVPYFSGDAISVRILSIAAAGKAPGEDIAARRQQALRQAVEQSDRTNAMIFAASFSGKWGDYDPQGIEKWEKQADNRQPPCDPAES